MKINVLDNSQVLKYSVHYKPVTGNNLRSMHFKFRHTSHSFRRASQRGMDAGQIAVTLEYGELYSKQGLNYYVLGTDNIPDNLKKDSSKLQNSVVIVAGDSDQVITCYRSKNAMKHIKKKQKQLEPKSQEQMAKEMMQEEMMMMEQWDKMYNVQPAQAVAAQKYKLRRMRPHHVKHAAKAA